MQDTCDVVSRWLQNPYMSLRYILVCLRTLLMIVMTLSNQGSGAAAAERGRLASPISLCEPPT